MGSGARKTEWKGVVMLLLTAMIWGSSFVAQSIGMEEIEAFTFNGIRALLGAAVLMPIVALRLGRSASSPDAPGVWVTTMLRRLRGRAALGAGPGRTSGVTDCLAPVALARSACTSAAGASPGRCSFVVWLRFILLPSQRVCRRPAALACAAAGLERQITTRYSKGLCQ